jgi:hypothetical protein
MQGPEPLEAMAAVAWEHVICLRKENIEGLPYRNTAQQRETIFGA